MSTNCQRKTNPSITKDKNPKPMIQNKRNRKKKIEKRKKKNYPEILVLTKKRRRKIQKRNNGFSKVALADSGGGRGCCARAMKAGGFLCEGDEGEGGFWRGRPGAGREGVVRGEAGSGWGGCARRGWLGVVGGGSGRTGQSLGEREREQRRE
jgi:hypothetical protein